MLAACGGGSAGAGDPPPGGFRDRYATAPASFTASMHTATRAADGSVILAGGSRGQGTLSDAIERFDPATGTIARIGSLSAGRGSHRATRLASRAILVTGGLVVEGDSRNTELIDEGTGTATTGGAMSVPRVDHAALALADGRVLVTGGNASGERAALGISDSAEMWDPEAKTFRRLAARMHIGRAAHTMTLLPDGRVLVVGGYTAAGTYQFAELFDPRGETFTPVGAARPMRASHAAHPYGAGQVLILGGETVAPGSDAIQPLASVLRFDAASNTFTDLQPLASPRTWAASVGLPGGAVLLFGGQRELPQYTASAEYYDPLSGGRAIAALDGERALHTATLLASGRVLIAGGEARDGTYTTTVQLYE